MRRGKEGRRKERKEGVRKMREGARKERREGVRKMREGARKERKEEALTSKCSSIPSIINSQCSPPMAPGVSPTEGMSNSLDVTGGEGKL